MTTDATDLTLDEIRATLAPSIASNAAFDGWSDVARDFAAEGAGVDPDVARLAFNSISQYESCDTSLTRHRGSRRLQSWVRLFDELVHTRPAHNALTSVDARFVLPVCACRRCAWHFNGARARAQLRVLCARKGSFAKPCEKSPAAAARGKCAARALLATLVRPGALYSLQWVCARDPSHYSSSLSSYSSSSTSSKACAASAASTPACAAKSAAAASPRRGANLPLI